MVICLLLEENIKLTLHYADSDIHYLLSQPAGMFYILIHYLRYIPITIEVNVWDIVVTGVGTRWRCVACTTPYIVLLHDSIVWQV